MEPAGRKGAVTKGWQEDGLGANDNLANGAVSPYAAALLGNMRHWLEDDPEIRAAVGCLPFVDCEELC
ncbi:MAG: hypothetical protein QNI89_15675 [Desulfobacterales bacterium]|nr:hypothetical protein [Desulfobacterales bacterium]MDJ0888747.1 hypothetical protein [Desulfobacterales bacterium]